MHIAICDDDSSHISHITQFLSAYRREKQTTLTWTAFPSGFALLSALDRGDAFDAVFLDIFMDDMNGMDVAKRIRAMNNSIHILFLTSSPLFAVESYVVEATDYLLKPIDRERMYHSLDRLFARMEGSAQRGITVKDTDGLITKVLWNQLMYLEAMGHYVILHHTNGTATKTLMAFSSLLEVLGDNRDFIQSHRSYIVNLRYVHRVGKRELVMLNGVQIPLPKSRYQQLSDRFHEHLFGGEGV